MVIGYTIVCYHEKEMMAIKVGWRGKFSQSKPRPFDWPALFIKICDWRAQPTQSNDSEGDEARSNYYPSVFLRVKEKYIR
jgi:hypothetical protein